MYYRKNGQKVRSVEGYNTPLEKFAFKSIERFGSNKKMNVWTIVFIIAIAVICLLLTGWFIWMAVKHPKPQKSKFGGKSRRRR
jgi:hypothetical protein